MTIDPAVLNGILLIAFVYGITFIAALWLSLVLWTLRDIRARSRNVLTCLLATLVVIVFFLPGVIIYLILRPRRTIEEEYQLALNEEAILQSIKGKSNCPNCSRKMAEDWIVCPWCHTRLKKKCPQCGKLIELQWNICPFCTIPTQGTHRGKANLESTQSPMLSGSEGMAVDEREPSQKTP
jgi:RNA polymerase subunit RPABC4/transcription elongation factor Spt4